MRARTDVQGQGRLAQKPQNSAGERILRELTEPQRREAVALFGSEDTLRDKLAHYDELRAKLQNIRGDTEVISALGVETNFIISGIPVQFDKSDVIKLLNNIDDTYSNQLTKYISVLDPLATPESSTVASTTQAKVKLCPTLKLIDFIMGKGNPPAFGYPRGLYFGLDNTVSTALSGLEIMQQPNLQSTLHLFRIMGMDERQAKLAILCDLSAQLERTAVAGKIKGVRLITSRTEKKGQGDKTVRVQIPWPEARVVVWTKDSGSVEYMIGSEQALPLSLLGGPVSYRRWTPIEKLRDEKAAELRSCERDALAVAQSTNPTMRAVSRVQFRPDFQFRKDSGLFAALQGDAEEAVLSFFGGLGRGILAASMECTSAGKVLWWGKLTVFVGDLEPDKRDFLNSFQRSLQTGKGASKSKILSFKAKEGSIEVVHLPMVDGRPSPIEAPMVGLTLTEKLEQLFLERPALLPAKTKRGDDLVWMSDEQGQATPLSDLEDLHLMETDDPMAAQDLRRADAIAGYESDEIYGALINLEESGIIVIYPERVDSKDTFIIRHCLRDSDHRRARRGAGDGEF